MISPNPKIPIAIIAKDIPLLSSGIPKLNLGMPELTSSPTIPSKNPKSIIANPFVKEPLEIPEAVNTPNSIKAEYSVGPKYKAALANGSANTAIKIVAIVPAKNDAMAVIDNAAPALPFFAIWCPSIVVTVDEISPGIFINIAVIDPPYCVP